MISRTATRGNRQSNLEGLLCSTGDRKTSLLQLRFLFSFGKPQREKWVPLGAGGTNGRTRVPAGQGTQRRVFPPADRRVKSIQGRPAGRCFFQPPHLSGAGCLFTAYKYPESLQRFLPSFLCAINKVWQAELCNLCHPESFLLISMGITGWNLINKAVDAAYEETDPALSFLDAQH